MIYLDYAASTPMSEQALDVFVSTSKRFYGNSMSLHDMGSEANHLLAHCRKEVATRLSGEERGVVFTSGGSESNWLAIYGLAMGNRSKGQHILVGSGAHGSVKSAVEWLMNRGFRVDEIPTDSKGQINSAQLAPLIKPDTILVILAHVNSEFGFIVDIEKVGTFLEEKGILFHVDAVQSFGKLPINLEHSRLSSLSFSSHKIYGPKGVGGLYVNPRLQFEPFQPSVSQEFGLRQGTVNVPGIAAFTEAMGISFEKLDTNFEHVKHLKSHFLDQIRKRALPIVCESPLEITSPYILALRVLGLEGQWVMLEANRRGVAVSTGSACTVHDQKPSYLLLGMGRSLNESREVVRLSFGTPTTIEEIDQAVNIFEDIIIKQKN